MSKLETNTIDTISGSTNLTLGGTNATDITIPVGVTITNNGTQSGFGGTNTPAFSITKNALQSTSAGSNVLITWQATNLDTDSGVDLTNNKYVVPTGKGGNYFLSLQVSFDYGTRFILSIYKNGTAIRQLDTGGGSSGETALNFNAILSLAAADELTAYYYSVTSTGNIRYQNSSGTQITRFEGYKIIE